VTRQLRRVVALALITMGGVLAVPAAAAAAPSYTIDENVDGDPVSFATTNLFASGTFINGVKKLQTTATGKRNLPFPVTLYGKRFTNLKVSTDGTIQWGPGPAVVNYANEALPSDAFGSRGFLAAYWGGLDYFATNVEPGNPAGDNVYVGTRGTAPNRIFAIRSYAHHDTDDNERVNVAVMFFESEPTITVAYMNGSGRFHTIGIQKTPTGPFSQWSHNVVSLSPESELTYVPTP
jgi:hypothetical protein